MRAALACAVLCLFTAAAARAQHHTEAMGEMSMDGGRFGKVLLDQLEWRGQGEAAWNAQAWYGGDYHKLWLKTEGSREQRRIQDASVELLWDRIISPWWSLQAGVRGDLGPDPQRSWAAVGLSGIAPQWFDVEATVYLGDAGRTAARLKVEYELLLTQRWILQPEIELNAYGRRDVGRGIEPGLSEYQAGLRLRYEIRRRFAPYLGVMRGRQHGVDETRGIAGLRVWF